MKKSLVILSVAVAALFCGAPMRAQDAAPKQAIAVLYPTAGNQCHGTVRFTQDGDTVKVVADVEGLTPSQQHAFHIHEYGDASAPDATSAGGHFNPDNKKHGLDNPDGPHAGDMPNFTVDEKGKSKKTVTDQRVNMDDDAHSIFGHALVIHEKADDLKSDPAGNAGARIACGVISK